MSLSNKRNKKTNNLIIRFNRVGCKSNPIYHIILIKKGSGRIIEKLGYLNPNFSERNFFIDVKRLAFWTSLGAIVHTTLKRYLIKFLV